MNEDREEPHISSTLQWKDVTLPPSITEPELDEAIFSVLHQDWRKTASIIVRTDSVLKSRGIELDFEVTGARIRELAEGGQIDSQGTVSMWRHSEVRLRARS